jgi:predicted ATP-grasp superfamily ATP-dependent carboligase
LDQLLDKGLFAKLLRAKGVPHPRTLLPDEGTDFGQEESLEGFFLKPRDSQVFHERFGVKAFWPKSEADLHRQLEFLRGEGLEMMAQEYIPGPPSNHYFVDGFFDKDGRVPAVFVRRRLRMHPPRFGNSSYMVSISEQEADPAAETVTGLLAGLGYRGVFSAELKWDERDGLFKLLEVNARPWWFVEFAAVCGVNFLGMIYSDALKEPVDPVREYVVGKRLIHPYYDISACLRAGSGKVKGLVTFLGSIPGADRPILRWNDPLPAIYEFGALSKQAVRRRLRALLEKGKGNQGSIGSRGRTS